MSVKTAPLGSLCQMKHGGTPSKANPAYWEGQIPWVSPKDMKSASIDSTEDHISVEAVANSATSIVQKGTILVVVRSGILAHTLPIATVTGPTAFNQDIKALIPNEELVDPDYLYWFVRSSAPLVLRQGVKKGATVHSLQAGFLERLQVPMPTRSAQRQIVDLLFRAEGIVTLRRDAQIKTAAIIPALFIDMFGDPATNPKGWPMRAIQDLCSVQTGATPRREQRPYYDGGSIPWVKTGEVCESHIRQADESITDLAVSETNCKVFPVNTILIAMYGQGQTRGRAGMLKIPAATNQACAAILPGDKVDQAFLFEMLKMQYERLRAMGRGGNQANLNLGMIKALEVPCPPTAAQARFVAHITALESIQKQQKAAAERSRAAFEALLSSVFVERTLQPRSEPCEAAVA